jgi:hypothetical protein
MAAVVGERVLRIEERLERLERAPTATEPRPPSPSGSADDGA